MSKKLILKIHEKGLMIDLPGKGEFRTPVKIDVTNIPLQTLVFKLNAANIRDYELVSYTDNKKVVYKRDDKKKKKKQETPEKPTQAELPDEYIDSLNKKFNRMENLLGLLINNTSIKVEKKPNNGEQINKRLDRIEKMLQKQPKQVIVKTDSEKLKEPKIEDDDEFGIFVPKIETSGMKLSGGEHKEIESDSDADETANALSSLLKDETEE